ncbi:MAG: ORF6N domain-containing protein [Bacteroidetes bacterium]|nr:ORF6N domain-containing protein [Bacteroidota bacterium]
MPKLIKSFTPIENLVYFVRGEKVMLDSDLARIYGVETKMLNRAVKRNLSRFPDDFMFQLTAQEWETLKYQIGTSTPLEAQSASSNWGGRRTLPYVFTEHGAVMLASVLNSQQAIAASIEVVRVFIKLRELLSENKILEKKIQELEDKFDYKIEDIYKAIRYLMTTNSHITTAKKGVK